MSTQERALGILGSRNAVLNDIHVVYTSGLHGSAYVNKDGVYPYTLDTSSLCNMIAIHFAVKENFPQIEVVVAPAVGGVILSQWTAYHLTRITGEEVLSTYADKETVAIYKNDKDEPRCVYLHVDATEPSAVLLPGETLLKETGRFVIKRGYDKLVAGKNVLVVEDIINTGGSIRKTVDSVRVAGGNVVAAAAICNRGGKTAEDIGVEELFCLVNVNLEACHEEDCQKCKDGVPINTDVGKGGEYLARKRAAGK